MKKQHIVLRRAAALLFSFLCFAALALPCFVQPAAAYDAQGDVAWYITGEIRYDGQDCYIIGMNADGRTYSSMVQWSEKYASDSPMSITPLGQNSASNWYKVTVYNQATLSVPRDGFYIDEDWYIHFVFDSYDFDTYYGYAGVTMVNPYLFPTTTARISGTTVQMWTTSDVVISNVYPYYYQPDGYQLAEISEFGDAVLPVRDACTLAAYTVTDPDAAGMDTDLLYVPLSLAGSYSADVVPLVVFTEPVTDWVEAWCDLSYEYYVPKSKLGTYSVGDKFPHSTDVDIDAILDALDSLEDEYAREMQHIGQIRPSDLDGFNSMLYSTESTANNYFTQNVGTVDSEALSLWFVDNPFMSIIGMIVCIGFVGMILKKAVT